MPGIRPVLFVAWLCPSLSLPAGLRLYPHTLTLRAQSSRPSKRLDLDMTRVTLASSSQFSLELEIAAITLRLGCWNVGLFQQKIFYDEYDCVHSIITIVLLR